MSKTIDEQVVEMRFDNSHFEKNVRTSMNTLQKLKQSLDLRGASKGLNDVGSAAKKCDLSPLGNSVQSVQAKFSAMSVIGVTALANITNSAINAGKNIVSALTIQPVTTGFSEYELKMGSIQTIMASTGASLETVNKYLNELNEYSDQTIYSFSDMTQSIGKFTNAGVSLDKAVLAIKGISNEAAVSGANANEASRAMYNFAQALSAGYVKLIDWKSIELANMATVEFKEQLIETAVEVGTLTKVSGGYKTKAGTVITATKNFNDSLQDQWMTTKVLINTLSEYADETTEIGKKASQAATEVKTFSQLFDTLKESAQSGWATSWEIIVGDYTEAKSFLTWLNGIIGDIISKSSEKRNNFLEDVLGDSGAWSTLSKKITGAGVSMKDFQNTAKSVAKSHGVNVDAMIKKHGSFAASLKEGWLNSDIFAESMTKLSKNGKRTVKVVTDGKKKLKELEKVAKRVIKGEFGNGEARVKALTKAGYKYSQVQTVVNQLLSGQKVKLENLSTTQLKQIGYTDKQIAAIKELGAEAEKSGSSLEELIEEASKPSGRDLLIDSFKNIVEYFKEIGEVISESWEKVFPKDPDHNLADTIYDLIVKFHDFTEAMELTEEQATNMGNAFQGLFDAFWLLKALAGGPLAVLRNMLTAVSYVLGIGDVWQVLGTIGSYISDFKAWIRTNNAFSESLTKMGEAVKEHIDETFESLGESFEAFKKLPAVQKHIENINAALDGLGDKLGEWLGGFVPIVEDFFNTLGTIDKITFESVSKAFKNFGKSILNHFGNLDVVFKDFTTSLSNACDFIVTFTGNTDNAFTALLNTIKDILEWIGGFGDIIVNAFEKVKNFDFSKLTFENIQNGIDSFITSIFHHFGKLGDVFGGVLDNIGNFGDMLRERFGAVGDTIADFIDKIVEFGKDAKDAIQKFFGDDFGFGQVAVVAMGASMIVMFMKLASLLDKALDIAKGWNEIGQAFRGMANNIGSGFKKLTEDLGKARQMAARAYAVRNFAIAIGILAASLWVLAQIPTDQLVKAGVALLGLAVIMAALAFALSKMDAMGLEFEGGAKSLLMLAGTLIILIAALKAMESLDANKVWKNLGVLGLLLGGMTVALIAIGKFAPKMEANTLTILALAIGLRILVSALAKLAEVEIKDMSETVGLLLVGLFSLAAVAELCGKFKSKKAVGMLAAVASFLILIVALEKLGSIDASTVMENIILLVPVFAAFVVLMKATEKAGEHAAKGGVAILLITISLGLMIGTLKLMGMLSANDLAKGVIAISGMMIIFGLVIALSKFAGEHAHKAGLMIMEMAVALFLLTLPLAVLSLLNPDGLERAVEAVQGLMIVFTLVIMATSMMPSEKILDKARGVIISMGVVLGVLAVTLGVLSMIKPEKLQSATEAMAIVMAMFALMISSTQFIGSAGKTIATVVLMTLAVGAMAGLIYMLSSLKPQAVMSSAAGLSMLLMTLSISMILAGNIQPTVLKAMPAMAIMLVVVGGIAAILGALAYLKAEPSIESAVAISLLLITMTGVLAALGLMGPLGAAAIPNLGILLAVVTAIGAFMIGVGALVKKFPAIEEFANSGIKMLNTIAEGIGSFVSSIMEGFTSNLPDMGEDLSLFADGLIPFIDGMKKIDESVLTGVKTLADAVATLSSSASGGAFGKVFSGSNSLEAFGEQLPVFGEKLAEFADKVSGINAEKLGSLTEIVGNITTASSKIPQEGLFGGGTNIEEFGTQLIGFGESLGTFSQTINGIENFEQFSKVTDAANEIVKMAEKMPEGGIFQNDLGDFSTHIQQFGTGLLSFSQNIAGIENTEKFKTVAEASSSIIKMSEDIPEGGLFVNDLGNFATHIMQFGNGLLSFSQNIAGIKNAEKFKTIAEASSSIVEMSENIPEGGLFVNDLGNFATHIMQFGNGLNSFSQNIAGIKNADKFKTIADASGHIVNMCNNLPESGFFDGKMDLGDIGNEAADLGEGLAEFSTNVAGVNAESVNGAVDTAQKLIDILNGMAGIDGSSADGFKTAMQTLGTSGVTGFTQAFVNAGNRINEATATMGRTAVNGFRNAITNNSGNIAPAVNIMIAKVKTAINNGKGGVTKAFTGIATAGLNALKTKYSSFSTVGTNIVSKLISGISKKVQAFTSKCKSLANSGKNGIREKYTSFYNAGVYLGEGLVAGINAKKQAAYNAGLAIGKASAQGVEDGAEEASPSKRAIRAGKYLGEGLVIGIQAMTDSVYKAGETMGADASDGLARALDPVKNLADFDIDTQPTIRPVLDLTDVQNGASRIGSILNGQRVSLSSSISSAVDRASSLGSGGSGDNEVVNAINRLRSDISGIPKTENNVNFNGAVFNDDTRIGQLALNLFYEIARKEAMG